MNTRLLPKCVLLDWSGTGERVAEGRILSSEPNDLVNDIQLSPNSVKVFIETAIKNDAFLWRPMTDMHTIETAVGEMIAWPSSSCVIVDQGSHPEDIAFTVMYLIDHQHIRLLDELFFIVSLEQYSLLS